MANGILVVAEHLRGELSEITFEMLGLGKRLAEELQAPLAAALVGQNVSPLAAKLGAADKVAVVESPRLAMPAASSVASALEVLVEKTQSTLVLVGGTNVSMGIGPLLSSSTGLPFVNFCKAARVESGALVVTSQLFGGKILSDVRLEAARGILSISPGAYPANAGRSDEVAPVERADISVEASPILFKRFIEPEPGDVDITKQDILVSVGRGIQSAENIGLAQELAEVLGGAVSASRPVVDQGWLGLSRQVGKSGMTVAPKLYLALGISGAPEHWEGMKNAKLIIAVNTDPKAPIFDFAHYGATVDCLDLIEPLKAAVATSKAAKST